MRRTRTMLGWRLLALAALIVYLVLALYQLKLPGLNYDETLDAVPAMQVVQGTSADSYGTLTLAGRKWPLMTMPYVGVTTTYYLVPIFALFGINVIVLRGAAVALGVLSLLLSWGFLRRYFDERVAALSILLLAVNPSFVFWSRMGAWVQMPLVPIAIGSLWSLFAWYKRSRARYLVLAAFLLGLGLATHIQFIWNWSALVIAWLLLSPWLGTGPGWRRWLWPWQKSGAGAWVASAAALLLGCTPLLVFNLKDLGTFRYTALTLATDESGWLGDLALFRGLPLLAWRSFETLLRGDWFVSNLGDTYFNPLAVPAFFLALAVIAGLASRHRIGYSVRRVALFVVLLAAIVAQSVVIHSAESAHHLLVLWPMPQALVSVALFGLFDVLAPRFRRATRVPAAALGVIGLCLVFAEGGTTYRYHRTLSQSGGVSLFSDAIYDLAADLDRPGMPPAVSMDWGFRKNLQLLTQGRVDPPEWFTYTSPPAPEFYDYVAGLIAQNPRVLYLFHSPGYTAFLGHLEGFEEIAYRNRLRPVLVKTYNQRDGRPVIQTYTLEPAPRLFEQPPISHPIEATRLLSDSGFLTLLGYDLPRDRVRSGEEFELTLYWQALAPQARSQKVFVHLLDDDGKLWTQHDSPPVFGNYPVTEWQAGEVVPDRIWLQVPGDVPPGTYHLFVGMYDKATGKRLPLSVSGQPLEGDTLGLADITVD